MIARVALLLLVAAVLAGCAHGGITSISGGESKVFEAPPYAVAGKTQYDQNVIDGWVEGGVAAFGWKRPAPRPPELDASPAPKKAVVAKKKKSFIRRIKDRVMPPAAASVWPDPSTFRQVELPAPAPQPQRPTAAPASVPPLPRDAVDELLDPTPATSVHPKR